MANEKLVDARTLTQLFGYQDVSRIDQLVRSGIITATKVREFGDSGRMVRKYDLIPVTHQYIMYLRGLAEKRQDGAEDAAKMVEADLRYKEARAERMELEIKELRGQMHRAEDVAALTNDMIAKLRGAVMAIPGQVAVDCAEARTATEAAAVVKYAVDSLLNEFADYRYTEADYKRLVREREKWITEMEQELEEQSSYSSGSGEDSEPQRT